MSELKKELASALAGGMSAGSDWRRSIDLLVCEVWLQVPSKFKGRLTDLRLRVFERTEVSGGFDHQKFRIIVEDSNGNRILACRTPDPEASLRNLGTELENVARNKTQFESLPNCCES